MKKFFIATMMVLAMVFGVMGNGNQKAYAAEAPTTYEMNQEEHLIKRANELMESAIKYVEENPNWDIKVLGYTVRCEGNEVVIPQLWIEDGQFCIGITRMDGFELVAAKAMFDDLWADADNGIWEL